MVRHGHRGVHHHHHSPRHHHRNPGAYPGGAAPPGITASPSYAAAICYFVCAIFPAMFGVCFLLSGTVLMAIGYNSDFGIGPGIAGTVLFAVGVGLVTTCCILCCCARKKKQESTIVNLQDAEGTTLGYDQPGGMQAIVQPPPPPGAVAYGPGGGPIASQAAPPGVTIVYGPGAGQPQTESGFQPQPQHYPNQPYPATAPYPPAQTGVLYSPQPGVPCPPQPVNEPAGEPAPPPPPYDEAVKSQAVAVDIHAPVS